MEDNFFKFSNLTNFPEVVHGISTRSFGNMKLKSDAEGLESIKNREKFCKELGIELSSVVVAEIVHNNIVINVGPKDRGRGANNHRDVILGVDGLTTNRPGVYLMVTVADCLPILAYDPVTKISGIAHAGWRGILKGVANQLVNKMAVLGAVPENINVGVGPGICQKHFVVKDDVLDRFKEIYPKTVLIRNHDGYVDLKRCVEEDLLRAGVSKLNLEMAKECTVCDNYYFSSFRYEKVDTIYQAAVIGVKE